MLIESQRISYTLLMPTHCYDLLNHPDLGERDTSSLTRAILAGATPDQRRLAESKFCGRAYPMYGMSESMAHCTCAEDDDEVARLTTDGRPLPGTALRVLDDAGRPVASGEIGNVFLRGPNRMRCYQSRPDLTAHVLSEDGWFATGDRGKLYEGEYLTFMARASEVIRRGGMMIQPAEVEAALRSHPAIASLAVVAVPDARLGERVCACVQLRQEATLNMAAMQAHLETAGLPRYQWPEFLLEFEDFPRTPSLKVRRADLARIARDRLREPAG
jgi:acyl-CoA synthetase (AMP-forming)/AMP-acid ligase II